MEKYQKFDNTIITIKTERFCIQEHSEIEKILATVNAKNLAKIIDVVGLEANPRKSKTNLVTKAIGDTLRVSPEKLRFRSKGILISSSSCTQRERGRFTLSFEDPSYEGVLDGGHNVLAAGIFILEEYFGEEKLLKISKWDDFIEKWRENRKDLSEILEIFDFEMPIEIIYPTDDEGSREKFPDAIFDISQARNNNVALTAGTKANHKNYYQILKDNLDSEVADKVQWKDGEMDKTIKRDDVVALSLVPLLALQKAEKLQGIIPQINPSNLYNSKSKCIENFSTFFENYKNEEENKTTRELVESAMSLFKLIPKLYDLIYKCFPNAYNANSQRFGGISSVKIYDKNKKGKNYLNKPPLTKYYKQECPGKYPDGFIMPIVASLYALMKVESNRLEWKVDDPCRFIEENINEAVKILVSNIKENSYNPSLVGKSNASYQGMEAMFESLSK